MKARLPFEDGNPFTLCMDEVISQTEAIINGRRTILAGTNNYLGLTFHPDCIAAAKAALDSDGTGTTGSRVLNGTYSGHRTLEKTLAEFYGTEHAMVFSTGYQANLGMISTLCGSDDFILIDADSHASIYDGCKMGNATVIRFKHNDAADLDKRLKRIDPKAGRLVVIEGLYSMLGDKAPVKELVAVAKAHGAAVLVDEAHSMGVFGATGRGVVQEEGIEDQVDFIVGTFSKSVGTIGGFCVSNHPKFEVLRYVCRPYLFTASLPPSVVASATAAIRIMGSSADIKDKLWDNARQLHQGLSDLGFELGAPVSPISAVIVRDQAGAMHFWSQLLKAGVYVNLAFPPATPAGVYLLRCSLSAAHTAEQIEIMLEKFAEVGAALGILSETHLSGADARTSSGQPGQGVAAATA
ncbi:aminotransferase class I/II-fold pyridoxal phosphate-dependent enzyme [Alphaproteobacteria bacterium LMG 31809]|uniref:Aminotransferase class I/II-fold pyridoxal phosphate-dependent enzyme n=2 Tax=Govanella unica TaxID=2975056 RepID=A0A9X3Z6X6_9PROT|nr:aminotransferase class I/II-fold pyridoxal phosphate-dependent enzyme [Govania unica]